MKPNKAFYSIDNINKLYVSRSERGRELFSIEDCLAPLIRRVEEYIELARHI